ncbi:hypothetical protein BUALT_Bualt09G0040000 [Buddleja alternifolia]|uniref:Growth-regulating factor n=1 Tax=Buddleja alternifolia TaxID=168488 RepID=A0AAV6X740_9LAMI|nr:hypothetical protein BUALT_Bualt09G0040000 [Buddleja alternifolia]
MVSGIPIPPDLLFTIRRSLDSNFLLHQHPQRIFQMGYGRKIDPEPGRCRRTDGKKWRCSKEAYPDSKYCERHMHRGRNRSRKPVEIMPSSSTTNTSKNITIPTSHSQSHFLYPHFSSSKAPGVGIGIGIGIGLSSQESTTNNFFLEESDWHSRPALRDFRYGSGMKGESDEEHTFISVNQASSWQLGSSDHHLSQMKNSLQSYQQQQQLEILHDNMTTTSSSTQQQQHNSYYNITNCDDEAQPKKVMHHFFDEWSPKDHKHSWPDHSEDSIMSSHRTQLSISTPNSMHDFFITPKCTIGLAFGFPSNPKAAAEDEKLLSTFLQTIESFWLEVEGDGPFLLGNSKPSIADLALVCEIMQIEVADENDRERILGPDKKVLKWIEDRKVATAAYFDEIHSIMLPFKEKLNELKARASN